MESVVSLSDFMSTLIISPRAQLLYLESGIAIAQTLSSPVLSLMIQNVSSNHLQHKTASLSHAKASIDRQHLIQRAGESCHLQDTQPCLSVHAGLACVPVAPAQATEGVEARPTLCVIVSLRVLETGHVAAGAVYKVLHGVQRALQGERLPPSKGGNRKKVTQHT